MRGVGEGRQTVFHLEHPPFSYFTSLYQHHYQHLLFFIHFLTHQPPLSTGKMLLDHGATLRATDEYGRTALHYCCRMEDEDADGNWYN